jgi:hypothetical protein
MVIQSWSAGYVLRQVVAEPPSIFQCASRNPALSGKFILHSWFVISSPLTKVPLTSAHPLSLQYALATHPRPEVGPNKCLATQSHYWSRRQTLSPPRGTFLGWNNGSRSSLTFWWPTEPFAARSDVLATRDHASRFLWHIGPTPLILRLVPNGSRPHFLICFLRA